MLEQQHHHNSKPSPSRWTLLLPPNAHNTYSFFRRVFFSDEKYYDGTFNAAGQRHGGGTLRMADGRVLRGAFKNGELQACHEFCPCCECLLGRHLSCELKAEMGAMHRVAVPWLSGPQLRQLEELAAWGEMLKAGMIVGYTADASETHIEGSYWLALIKGPAFPVPESQLLHASDQFQAGWLVVKAQWFELLTTSPRCYKLSEVVSKSVSQ